MTTPSEPTPQPAATPITYWEAPQAEVGPAPGVKFAGHGSRLVAYIIDSLIIGLLYLVIFVVMSAAFIGTAATSGVDFETGLPARGVGIGVAFGLMGLVFLFALLLPLVYFPFFWARTGQTPGMRPFDLYVVRDSDGGKISGGQAILRLIGMWVSAIPLYLGFIWIFIDVRRRAWHDLIAGTVVIERARGQ